MNDVNSDSGHTVEEISKPRRPRGFAAMSAEKRAEIASKGGKKAHAAGTAHKFQPGSALAKSAGFKGGKAPHISRGRKITNETAETLRNEHNETMIPASKVA
jgi:general stress protein YciG